MLRLTLREICIHCVFEFISVTFKVIILHYVILFYTLIVYSWFCIFSRIMPGTILKSNLFDLSSYSLNSFLVIIAYANVTIRYVLTVLEGVIIFVHFNSGHSQKQLTTSSYRGMRIIGTCILTVSSQLGVITFFAMDHFMYNIRLSISYYQQYRQS